MLSNNLFKIHSRILFFIISVPCNIFAQNVLLLFFILLLLLLPEVCILCFEER